jgi:hypothetical protein
MYGQKHLYVKDAVNRDSTIQSDEEFKFPISRPDDRAIPSGRPTVNCSIHPDDVSYRLDARQTSIIRPDPTLYREASVPACIRPDLSAARPDVHQ